MQNKEIMILARIFATRIEVKQTLSHVVTLLHDFWALLVDTNCYFYASKTVAYLIIAVCWIRKGFETTYVLFDKITYTTSLLIELQ